MATPALAEFTLGGYFRTQGYMQNAQDLGAEDPDTYTAVDQRFRAKLGYTLNDYVSFVYYGEVDTMWGASGSATKYPGGQGGEVGADGVNFETKNVYVDFKIPDTRSNLRLGIQGVKDAFEGVVFWDDMAAANLSGAMGAIDYTLLYSKWNEGNTTNWDDRDFYAIDLSHKYGDYAKAGVAFYYLDDNRVPTESAELWYAGLYGDYRFGNMGIDGFFVYNGGTVDDETGAMDDLDVSAWVASVKAKMVVRNGDLGLRYIYYSSDDDYSDEDIESFSGSQGKFEFVDENLSIFLVDKFVNNVPKNRYAIDAALAGAGMHALVFSGNFKNLPVDSYAGFGVGAFFVDEDEFDLGDGERLEFKDKDLGYEFAARIGKKFAEKYDVSLRGAYAILGDFFDGVSDVEDEDADDVWTTTLMVNVPF